MYEKQVLGSGKPILAVTACIHGNEVVGKHVFDWLKEQDIKGLQVWLIFGNPKAYEQNVRFTQENLNRVFPGKKDGSYEEKEAYRMIQEIEGADLHIDFHSRSTVTDCTPFVITTDVRKDKELIQATRLEKVVVYPRKKTAYPGKTLNEELSIPSIAVECGQHEQKNTMSKGVEIMKNVLDYFKSNKNNHQKNIQEFFQVINRLEEPIKDMVVVDTVKEFELVKKGDLVAIVADKGLLAEQNFYPILIDRVPKVREKGVLMLMSNKLPQPF